MDSRQTKPLWNSRTLWGSVIMLASFLGQTMGWFEITEEEQATLGDKILELSDTIGIIVGMGVVWWGRFKATKRLTLK